MSAVGEHGAVAYDSGVAKRAFSLVGLGIVMILAAGASLGLITREQVSWRVVELTAVAMTAMLLGFAILRRR